MIKDVGRRIAEIRRRRAWTQDQFAERLEVSVQYVRRVEGGGENLTLRSLVEIASVLGAKTIELLSPPASRVVRKGRPKNPTAK